MKVFTTAKERKKTSEFSITGGYFLSQGYLLLPYLKQSLAEVLELARLGNTTMTYSVLASTFLFSPPLSCFPEIRKTFLSFFGKKNQKGKKEGKRKGKRKEKE